MRRRGTAFRVLLGLVGVVFGGGVFAARAAEPCLVYLVPGALGGGSGGSSLWVGKDEYFSEYREFFASKGCEVHVGELTPDGTIEERAMVLKDQVGRFAHGRRVTLVAHSQGGLDARFAIQTLGLEGISKVVTLGTPHAGTPLADWVVRERDGGGVLYWVLRLLGRYDLRALRFAGEMTPDFLNRISSKFTARPGVRYASAEGLCRTDCHLSLRLLARWTGVGAGDGLVPAENQRFGEDLGTFDLDHLSEVGADAGKRAERRRFLERVWAFISG